MTVKLWKDIKDYEGFYQVSNKGDVKSIDRTITRLYKGSLIKQKCKGIILASNLDRYGRPYVTLSRENIKKSYKVHRLVISTFIGSCPDGMECCHSDDNCKNNQIENLRWDYHKENEKDKINNGKSGKGEKNGMSKLKNEDVLLIKKLILEGKHTNVQISKIFAISEHHVCDIKNKRRWKHITI